MPFKNKYAFSYGENVLDVHLDGRVGHSSSTFASWKPHPENLL
jgi:hypothetical protein